jgi:hypothetical protein
VSALERMAQAHARYTHADYPHGCDNENGHEEFASDILATDFDLAQDIEDGRALRELREALPSGPWHIVITQWASGSTRVEAMGPMNEISRRASSIAEAADACRKALPR